MDPVLVPDAAPVLIDQFVLVGEPPAQVAATCRAAVVVVQHTLWGGKTPGQITVALDLATFCSACGRT